jgi:hypothetical protein
LMQVAMHGIAIGIQGPNDRTLRATYTNVNDGSQYFMRELALVVNAVCEVVPRGVLCFLPSYSMLDKLMQYMDENAILRKIQLKKVGIWRGGICSVCRSSSASRDGAVSSRTR